jgi:hypothetical protein
MTEQAAASVVEKDEDASYDAAFNAQVEKIEGEAAKALPEPAKEPAVEGSPTDGKEPAKEPAAQIAPTAAQDEAFLATLPEAARERLSAAEERARKLDLDNRSLAGRMSAYQRRYEEAAGKRPAEAAKAATAEQTVEWTQFQTDYPDIAKAIESKYAASLPATETPELKGVVEYVEQQKRERFLNDAWDAVEAVHAGWRDTGKTPAFQAWKKSSQTYEKLASSDDISDAIALFDLYDGHLAKTGAPRIDPAQAAATATLAARRGAQVEGAQSAVNKNAAPNENVDVNDPDQLFAFYAAQSDKRLKTRLK